MHMQDPTDTRSLAHLARLTLSEEQIARFSKELGHALMYVSQLANANTGAVVPSPNRQPLAEDALRTTDNPLAVSKESLLENVPSHKNGLIKVRAVL